MTYSPGDPWCSPDENGHIACPICRAHEEARKGKESNSSSVRERTAEEKDLLLEDVAEAIDAWRTKLDELEILVDDLYARDSVRPCMRIIAGLRNRMKMWADLLAAPPPPPINTSLEYAQAICYGTTYSEESAHDQLCRNHLRRVKRTPSSAKGDKS